MKLKDLITKLTQAYAMVGNQDVLLEVDEDCSLNAVCLCTSKNGTEIRLTDNSKTLCDIYNDTVDIKEL